MRIRFRLSALLIAIMIVALCLGVTMTAIRRANEQRRFCELVRAHGGEVHFRYALVDVGMSKPAVAGNAEAEGPIARRLIRRFGAEGWGTVTALSLRSPTEDADILRIASAAAAFPSIESVGFDGQSISDSLIARLNNLPNLQGLSFRNCVLDEGRLGRLRTRELRGLQLIGSDAREWSWIFLCGFPRFSSIYIADGGINVNKFADAVQQRSLERLILLDVDLVGDAAPLFGIACESLSVAGVPISADDLSGIATNKILRSLALRQTDVSDEVASKLAQLSLEHLDLSYTSIGDAAVRKIARMSTLESLELDGTNITDNGVLQLGNLKNLRSLSVSLATEVTLGGLEKLHAQLPACQIQYTGEDGGVRWIGQDSEN